MIDDSDRQIERMARAIAAHKIGSTDPTGHKLPDDVWSQALPEARAAWGALEPDLYWDADDPEGPIDPEEQAWDAGPLKPIEVNRAVYLPTVWYVSVPLDTDGDGCVDDHELRQFASAAEAERFVAEAKAGAGGKAP